MQYAIILLSSLLFAVSASAAPTVSSVSGTVTHGESITVSGSGFGSKSTAEPNLWDTIDNKYSLSDGQTIPTGGSYPWNAQSSATYETSDTQRGKSTAMYKGTNMVVGDRRSLAGNIYLSFWIKFDRDVVEPAGQHSSKFIRLSNSSHFADPNVQTFSWTQQHIYAYNSGYLGLLWLDNGETDWAKEANTWAFMELSINNSNSTYSSSVNGIAKTSNQSWSESFDLDSLWSIGFSSEGANPPSPVVWIDDIYLDTTFQRVMICAGSTWAARGHCEIQIPSAWSDTSATVTVNQGAFADSSTNYLYVVDSAGAANSSGLEITFGSSGGGSTGSLRSGVSAAGVTFR